MLYCFDSVVLQGICARARGVLFIVAIIIVAVLLLLLLLSGCML